MLSNLVPYGSSRPKFQLMGKGKQVARRITQAMYRLPGLFTFTNGSAVVNTTESMINVLEAGDVLTPNKSKRYWVSVVDSATKVTLTANFAETTVSSGAGYNDRQQMWMPLTKMTSFSFPVVGRYGGPVVVELDDYGLDYRGAGFRPVVQLEWEMLSPQNVNKIITMFNHQMGGGRILVQPHDDVPIQWLMYIVSQYDPQNSFGKAVGTNLSLTFRAINPITQLPQSFASAGYLYPAFL